MFYLPNQSDVAVSKNNKFADEDSTVNLALIPLGRLINVFFFTGKIFLIKFGSSTCPKFGKTTKGKPTPLILTRLSINDSAVTLLPHSGYVCSPIPSNLPK